MKAIQENIKILITMTIINLIVLWSFISDGKVIHGIGYFIFFYATIAVIHFFTEKIPPKAEFEVKQPKKEFFIIIGFTTLGVLFLVLNFMQKASVIPKNIFTAPPIILGVLLFTFPLGIIGYLLIKKYKIWQLGLATKPISYLFLALIVWGLTGLFAYVFNRSGILFEAAYEEFGGITGIIIQGLVGAGLAEEFSRFIMQSRFEKVYHSVGFSILFASTIWAFMHFPVWYFEAFKKSSPDQNVNIMSIVSSCIQRIPLGFVWSYLTYRTRSLVPATLVHGFNLWGFQN